MRIVGAAQIVSGDTIVVTDSAGGQQRRVSLSSIRTPKIGRRDDPRSAEPYAREAREDLRQRLIGKTFILKSFAILGDSCSRVLCTTEWSFTECLPYKYHEGYIVLHAALLPVSECHRTQLFFPKPTSSTFV
jgi:hypothetical protein